MGIPPPSEDVAEIDAMYADALRHFEAGDLEGVLAHWEDDGAYLWPAVPPAIGKSAIRTAYQGFFSAWSAKEIYEPHEIDISGDIAYRRFSTDLTLTPKAGGESSRLKLNGIHIYERRDGGPWKFKVVIAINVPSPDQSKATTPPHSDRKTWESGFTKKEATEIIEGQPVSEIRLKYKWHSGPWLNIFDEQIELIQGDILRAKAEGKLVVYLSCPISARGGGYHGTNVDIAKHVERRLLSRWGEGFWVLNPAQYQLESKAGAGLIERHAKTLKIDLPLLRSYANPNGGDYMRMWTTVLAMNGTNVAGRKVAQTFINTGQFFDAFYFIGPRDVQEFFGTAGETLTSGIQEYFARKLATDSDFRDFFSVDGIDWHRLKPNEHLPSTQVALRDEWQDMRSDFFRYYAVRASVNFSLGSHDEWLIFKALNDRRRVLTRDPGQFMIDGDVGDQIAGYFDGGQINPASTEAPVSRGYSV
jgi:ketosteroid isomerase-like protein